MHQNRPGGEGSGGLRLHIGQAKEQAHTLGDGVFGHLDARLLINERRAAQYALNLDVEVLTVPAVIVTLCDQGIITQTAARRKLSLIEPITTASFSEALSVRSTLSNAVFHVSARSA